MVLSNGAEPVASAVFSIDELAALAGLLGSSRFPGVPEAAFSALAPQARDAALRAARRGLVARGVVGFGAEGEPTLAPGYLELVAAPLTADIVVAVERRDRERTAVRQFYTRPDVAVEHGVAVGSVHRLARFQPGELAARVLEFAALERRAGLEAEPFTTTASAFALLREGVRQNDLAAAREALGSEGRAFAEAMERFVGWRSVRVLRRSDATVQGRETTWIDAGDALWQLTAEPARAGEDPGERRVSVAPVSAREIVDEVLAGLTGEGATAPG